MSLNNQIYRVVVGLTIGAFLSPVGAAHDGPHDEGVFSTRKDVRTIPPAKAEDVFHFVVYGDRTGGVPAGLKVLEQAVVDTNLLDPDLVLTVGDLIQGYNETPEWLEQMQEYKDIMDQLNMRWFPVAGNHDVYWRGPGKAPQGHHESNYEKHFGPLWYSFQHKNTGFIVLYSDEGDPETNRKAFNEGKLQMMSEEQLAFLDQALKSLEGADHVFCFLHHPRWIGGGYTGSNWDVVHDKLKAAGNVSAVFAGHIHHMRYDGPKDGIEYYTLATTGGHLSAEMPGAGYLHHLNMVSVRADSFKVASIPIGSVMDPTDFTSEFLASIDAARAIRPKSAGDSKPLVLNLDGSSKGEVDFSLTNSGTLPVYYSVSFDGAASGWTSTLDHEHFTLAPGEMREVNYSVRRSPGDAPRKLPTLTLAGEVLAEKSRIVLPVSNVPLEVRPAVVPADYFRDAEAQCLKVTVPTSAVRVDADEIKLADGPLTLEAWVRPLELEGYQAIIAKTQGSEYALFSDEGVPQFDINLDGTYYTAAAEQKLSTEKWTHLAGVFDGAKVSLFVDGKLAGQVAASGRRRTNQLPLYIGADPDQSGRPTRPMQTLIDEVRLSEAAVYATDFTPEQSLAPQESTVMLLHLDRLFGPFVLDHSDRAATATIGPDTQLIARP